MVEEHIPVSTVVGVPGQWTGPMTGFLSGPSPKTAEPDSENSDPFPKLGSPWLILSLALA